ncbi:FAD/NAD(P)-binding domain-containing protein [Calocera cornea HHB12733]|uniref:FAD/NAD(P)-binding domain-containing protein n=1 Tax=Calocera cornea HHB12733 TaxID=1353952 RepID=A0A165C8P9_9BASI|nr:FAD/NAD(P)-binding domain-containing protein [Calocera cornea HHB12733]
MGSQEQVLWLFDNTDSTLWQLLILTLPKPKHANILVIGGGPGGSYAATVLAREGFDVVLLEAAKFPRYHIGESMIPSVRFYFRLIDLDEAVSQHGFLVKPGAAFKLRPTLPEGYSSFTALGMNNTSWNFKRSEIDEMMLRYAEKSGVKVFEQFENNDPAKRPISAQWKCTPDGSEGITSFDYLVDASGRHGIMSTKYLKNRKFNASLNNVACWGYWKGTERYMPGTERDSAPWFEALQDETGWGWFIPLHDGTTSVGIVEDTAASLKKKQDAKNANNGAARSQKDHYLLQMKLCPGLMDLVGDAELVDDGKNSSVRSASDYSYTSTNYAGDHYRLVGDAGAFIDPLFSSGYHLALTDALSAAVTIASSIRGDVPEKDCIAFHDAKFSLAYTKFLIAVLSCYSQIRQQNAAVLSDINESDFQRAFDIINPVIQGRSETPKDQNLTPDEVEKAMEFCLPLIGLGPAPPVSRLRSVSCGLADPGADQWTAATRLSCQDGTG